MKTNVVYLLHFSRPISPNHTCQHYIGSVQQLHKRLSQHRAGSGARLCEVAKERGIGFVLVRTWAGGRDLERRLKSRKNAPKLCPVCNPPNDGPLFDALLDFTLADVDEIAF